MLFNPLSLRPQVHLPFWVDVVNEELQVHLSQAAQSDHKPSA